MSLTYTGTGGLYKRLGRIGGRITDILALMGSSATPRVLSGASLQTAGTNIESDAAESPAVSQAIDGHWGIISGLQNTLTGPLTQLATLAQNVLLEQVHADANLPQKTVDLALREMIRQMEGSGDDIADSSISVGSQTSVSSPVGTPVFVLHMKSPRGYSWQTVLAETLRLECVLDANGGGSARQETFSVRGQAPVGVWDYRWPRGSGASATINLADAQLNNSGATKLYNGSMEGWCSDSANTPHDWTALVGTAGTHFNNGATGYTLTGSLRFLGDGSTLTGLYQEFNKAHATTAGAGGTPATLKPATRYCVCLFVKVSAVPSTGVLRVALTDSSNTVLNDDLGNAQSFNVALTGASTSWAAYTGSFTTPTNLPSTYRLQLKLTTALENSKNAFVDDVSLMEAVSLYSGGPAIGAFAGATNCVLGDRYTIAITNTMGAVAALMERIFSLRDKGLVIPYDSANGETIADSVIA